MCEPLSEGKKNYHLIFLAIGKCDMGERHTVQDSKSCDTFAGAFKATREFWTANKGREITVTLSINPAATDHLSARA